MEPKGHVVLDRYPGEWEVMPSYIEEPETAACKWVSIREDNARHGLPAVFSILVYTHPETGFPLAICDGSHHTLMRTGASAAVSAKWLAHKDSTVPAIAGTGSVAPGAHLAALGADLEGEQELDPRILQPARVFVDDIRQRRHGGEIDVPLREGLISEDDLAGEIGKVICGEPEGHRSDDEIAVFDSTGIARQDSATVLLEYELAVAAGVGVKQKMIST